MTVTSPSSERTSLLTPSAAVHSETATNENGDTFLVELSDAIGSSVTNELLDDQVQEENIILFHEMEQPWPSTYERSIALLSSPILPIQNVALYTKSPKPGLSNIAALVEARRSRLDRGYYTNRTPDGHQPPQLGGDYRTDNDVIEDEMDHDNYNNNNNNNGQSFVLGSLARVKSMDFWSKNNKQKRPLINVNLQAVQSKQQQRLTQAQQYRQKLLQQSHEYPSKTKSSNSSTSQSRADTGSPKATFYQCSFNLANILMGVGLLGLPYVYHIAGYYGGTFCIISFGTMTWYTSILIGRTLNGDPQPSSYFTTTEATVEQMKNGSNNHHYRNIKASSIVSASTSGTVPHIKRMLPPITSFPEIARTAFGDYGCFVLSFILYFELFSCIAIFFVSMGDHLHQLLPNIPATTHMILVGGISMIPTIILRTPALLSYLSMVGTLATTAVVISVIASAFLEGNIAQNVVETEHLMATPPYHIGWKSDGLTLAFGLVAYCFSGHAIIPSIYTSMEKPQEFDTMVTYTFMLVICCCLSVAFSGYYIFGSTVQDQVTLSLERSSQAVTAMKALTWLMIMTAFSKVTLTMFPLALGMEEIVAPYLSSERMVYIASATIKLLLTILALCVAIFFPSFSLLCSFVGVICSMTVSVIFPAAAHLKMFGSRLSFVEKLIDWIFILLGIGMGVAGTIATLQ